MMKITKRTGKIYLSILFMFVTFFILPKSTLAAEEAIASIDVDVELMSDGSAIITEVWDIIDAYDGTEYYIVMNLPENMSVHSLEVWDESGKKFQTLDSWDVDASFEEKAYKAGILETDDGYELCWGISKYGDRTFTVRYTLSGLVNGYTDYAGFYHQFITHDLSSAPEAVSVNIHMNGTAFSEENTNMWADGFEGDISFTNDGAILASSSEELAGSDYVSIMVQFDRALFEPAFTSNSDFASFRDEVLAEAEPIPILYVILIIIAVVIVVLIAILIIVMFSSRIKLADGTVVKKPRLKDIEASSILPFNGNLPATFYALKKVGHPLSNGEAFGSYLMLWETEGIITIEKINKKKINIIFNDTTKSVPQIEATLYQILRQIAEPDTILSMAKLKKWASDGYDEIVEWEKELAEVGRSELLASGDVEADEKGKLRFTQRGYEKLINMWGFMKYLKEYESLHSENDMEMELWGDYLIFATLLGMTEEVKQYADTFDNDSMHIFQIMLLTHMLTDAAVPKFDTDSTNMTSMSGGFSGGGGGGGSR